MGEGGEGGGGSGAGRPFCLASGGFRFVVQHPWGGRELRRSTAAADVIAAVAPSATSAAVTVTVVAVPFVPRTGGGRSVRIAYRLWLFRPYRVLAVAVAVPFVRVSAAAISSFRSRCPAHLPASVSGAGCVLHSGLRCRVLACVPVGSVRVVEQRFDSSSGAVPAPDVHGFVGQQLGGDWWDAVYRSFGVWGKSAGYGRRWPPPRRCRAPAGASRSRGHRVFRSAGASRRSEHLLLPLVNKVSWS